LFKYNFTCDILYGSIRYPLFPVFQKTVDLTIGYIDVFISLIV